MNIFGWIWNGSGWIKAKGDSDGHLQVDVMSYSAIDHGDLLGLADDDHTQYLLRSVLTIKGDIYVAIASGVITRLAVGSNNQTLIADSAETPGIKWGTAGVSEDGWAAAGEIWTYASADTPTFTFTISGDKTSKYSPGMRIKLTQTTVKYFIITAVSYSSPNTTVTVYGGTDYTLANAAITDPYYSTQKAPLGFPLSPLKWTVEVTDVTERSQASPTNNTWYNLGTLLITIPIGIWRTYYKVSIWAIIASGVTDVYSTLSTANNSESDADFTGMCAGSLRASTLVTAIKTLNLSSKTVYYLNAKTTISATEIKFLNTAAKLVIDAICAYL